ncbi:MAG: BCCT family transporter [Bernardetiaceae bacterium]|jgi:glycine betaine transporter|nr:BCCT family transporter [Bernardetiaceae bacterium]
MEKPKPPFALWAALAFCGGFLMLAWAGPGHLKQWAASGTQLTLRLFGPVYLGLGLAVVLVLLGVAVSPWGRRRLGPPGERPVYGTASWIAMLYSTGMGAGLLLRAVQEPVHYYLHPPVTVDYPRAHLALEYTFFHWGLTPWGFYGLFGLVVAHYLHVRGRPVLGSSALGRHGRASWAATIDSVSIISTLLGVVAAIGLGSYQLLGGTNYLLNWQLSPQIGWLVVAFMCGLATLSARSGLGRSIKHLSNLNIAGTLLLLGLVLATSPLGQTGANFWAGLSQYLRHFGQLSLNWGPYRAPAAFLQDWTYFYWAFWLAWTPFTGVFIARISRGRTVRQFVVGTLVVPSLGTFAWFAAFGTPAFALAQAHPDQFADIGDAIFRFLGQRPAGGFASALALGLVATFLLTSIDSAIYVLSMFSDRGRPEPSPRHRWLWGGTLAAFTVTLIWLGGNDLLGLASQLLILFAPPFALIFMALVAAWLRQMARWGRWE